MAAALGLTAVLISFLVPAGAGETDVNATGDDVRRGQVQNDLGTMTYRVFVPPQVAEGDELPLVVHLHGANDPVDDTAVRSRLDELARERRFVVVYPQEDRIATTTGIWGWTQAAQQGREGRVPSLVADIIEEVSRSLPIDPDRITVGGFSAGAGMATVLAATHPDVFSGMQAEAGCMFNGAQCSIGTAGTTFDPLESARQAVEVMGPHARRQPFIVSSGSLDPLALLSGQEALVEQWLATNDLVDDGLLNGSVPATPASITHGSANGRSFEVASYVDADGCLLGQRYLVHGLLHSYSGGQPLHLLDLGTDPTGPRMRAIAHDFFAAQAGGTCPAAPGLGSPDA